jgi:NTE family protein
MLKDSNFLIEDGRIPFASWAVDIATARAVILTHGDIPDAMYASSAVPGVCKPHYLGDMRLLDGGLASLVPILAAHLLGAERIIAVDTDSKVRGTYDTVVQMIEQASAVRGYRWNMMETAQADLIIEPRVKQYYWWQFSRAAECITAGQEAARASLEAVRGLIGHVPDGRKQTKRAELAEYYPHIII